MVALVALLVIGPKQLPEAMRTLGLWVGRLQRSFNSVKEEISKEIGMDEIRRQLHNEAVMEEMKRIEREVKESVPDNLDKDIAPPPATDEMPARMTPAADEQTAQPEAQDSETQASNSEETATPTEPEPAPPMPRSEAELEAYHEAKAKQAAREKQEGSA